ncbi:hypothetical protein CFT12S00416_09120, partial [Campylobacter fetus subsp. testudinum]|uniref:hypothetical protein n=1 Tax=Campylobacter fetus TaxID=196 RepID=UPI00081F28CA
WIESKEVKTYKFKFPTQDKRKHTMYIFIDVESSTIRAKINLERGLNELEQEDCKILKEMYKLFEHFFKENANGNFYDIGHIDVDTYRIFFGGFLEKTPENKYIIKQKSLRGAENFYEITDNGCITKSPDFWDLTNGREFLEEQIKNAVKNAVEYDPEYSQKFLELNRDIFKDMLFKEKVAIDSYYYLGWGLVLECLQDAYIAIQTENITGDGAERNFIFQKWQEIPLKDRENKKDSEMYKWITDNKNLILEYRKG